MSQKDWVKNKLDEQGWVSRNQALQNYISRLGAIMFTLKREGVDFVSYRADNGNHIYKLIK